MNRYIRFILIFFFLIIICNIVNTYCKYQSNNSFNNSIAIAKWEVDTNINNEILNLVSNNNVQDYIVNISYKSDVASDYQIILSNIPEGIKVSLNDDMYINSDNNHQIVFNAGIINATKEQVNIADTLHFISTLDSDNLSNYKIQIEVVFNQKR